MPSEIDIFLKYISMDARVHLGHPTTEQEIAKFETQYDVKLLSDVREYFLKINGMYISGGFVALGAIDEWCAVTEYEYSAYDREDIDKILNEPDKYFRFGHYDIAVWDWAIRLDANPNIETPIIVIYTNATKIADSFTDFLQKFRTTYPEHLLGFD